MSLTTCINGAPTCRGCIADGVCALADDTLTCEACGDQYDPADGCQDNKYLCAACLRECPTCLAGIIEQLSGEPL